MPRVKFRYWSIDAYGVARDGVLDAPNPEEARARLESQGMQVLTLKPEGRIRQLVVKAARTPVLSSTDKLSFFTHLRFVLQSGISITHGLDMVANNSSPELSGVTRDILRKVETGTSLSAAVASTKRFDRVTTTMLKVGEETGRLASVCDRIAARLRRGESRRRQVVSALAYPLSIAIVCVGLLIFLISYMLPQFTATFSQLGGDLPALTRVVMLMGSGPWVAVGLGTLSLALLCAYAGRNTPTFAHLMEKLAFEAPLLGPLSRKDLLCRLSSDLAMMVELGVPLERSLHLLTDPTSGYYVMDEALKVAQIELRTTGEMLPAFQESDLFPNMWTQMVFVGLETGQLDRLLLSFTTLADAEVESGLDSLTQMLEPVLLGAMGLMVGGVVLSAFLPMYKLLEKI